MNTYIKSALNKIKAEDDLVEKTEKYLRNTILNNKDEKIIILKNRSVFSMKKFALAACAVVLVFGMSFGGYAFYKSPVAYLSLDINPSVELGVNAFNQVVSATGYNADGKTILDGQNVINSNVKDAVSKLVTSASNKGFIASDGSTIVSLTSETKNASTGAILEKDAEQGANEAIKSKGDTAVVYKDNVALSRRDEARKLGVTPGKLNLIQKLQTLDPKITVAQYKDAKVTEIMKKVVELKKSAKIADSASSISADKSDADTKDIEKAAEQSDKNKNEKAVDNEKNDNTKNTVSTSSTAASSTKVDDNNDSQKDKNVSDSKKDENGNNKNSEVTSSLNSSNNNNSNNNKKGNQENSNN